MLSISHAATGALIASKTLNPWLYVPAAIVLHFIEDMVPHWDVGEGMADGRRTKKQAFWLELGDLTLMMIMLYFFWFKESPGTTFSLHILIGAIAGILPDFIEAPRIFLGIDLKFLRPINYIHEKFHLSIPNKVLGLIPQILLLMIVYFLR